MIIQKRYSNFEVTISDYLPGPDLVVNYTLIGAGNDGSGKARTFLTKNIKMEFVAPANGKSFYAAVLDQSLFPRAGIYSGLIQAYNKMNPSVAIYENRVDIKIEEPELALPSQVKLLGKNLSYMELLEYAVGKSLQVPFPVTIEEDGREVFHLYSGVSFPLVVQDSEGGPVPLGSYVEVYDKLENKQVPVNNQLQLPLFWTNENGTPKGFANAEPIASGLVSYTFIQNLPRGEYFATIHITGKRVQVVHFDFPNTYCKVVN